MIIASGVFGTNYKISATGEAGPYGRVWLSYEFTDKLGLGDSRELRALRGRRVVSSSPPPRYRAFVAARAPHFRWTHWTWCRTGVINVVSGDADFVAKTMTSTVSQLKFAARKKGAWAPLEDIAQKSECQLLSHLANTNT